MDGWQNGWMKMMTWHLRQLQSNCQEEERAWRRARRPMNTVVYLITPFIRKVDIKSFVWVVIESFLSKYKIQSMTTIVYLITSFMEKVNILFNTLLLLDFQINWTSKNLLFEKWRSDGTSVGGGLQLTTDTETRASHIERPPKIAWKDKTQKSPEIREAWKRHSPKRSDTVW